MLREIVQDATADVRKPWGVLPFIALAGAALSLTIFKAAAYEEYLPARWKGRVDDALIPAGGILLCSLACAAFALTRRNRSRLVPAALLLAILSVGAGEVLISAVEIPFYVLGKLDGAGVGVGILVLLAVGVCAAALAGFPRGRGLAAPGSFSEGLRDEWRKPIGMAAMAAALAALVLTLTLRMLEPLHVVLNPQRLNTFGAWHAAFLVLDLALLAALVLAVRPIWRTKESRLPALIALATLPFNLVGVLGGLYVVFVVAIGLIWSLFARLASY